MEGGDIPNTAAEEFISSQAAIVLVLVAFTVLLLGYLFVLAPKLEGDKSLVYEYELPKERFEFYHVANHPPPEGCSQLQMMMYRRILAGSLLKWAIAGLDTFEQINKDHSDYQRMYKSGMCDEFLWNSVVAAKADLDQEMNDVLSAVELVNKDPNAKNSIFKEAAQIRQRVSMVRKQLEAEKEKAKEEEENKLTAEEQSEKAAAELIKEEEEAEKAKEAQRQ